jgi:plastocyanin
MTRSLSAVVMVLAMAGVACDDTATGTSDYDAQISVSDNNFFPSNVTIPLRGRVLWIWSGSNPHDVVFVGQANAPQNCAIQGSGLCGRRFFTQGSFGYVCTLHAGMTGVVNVTP